jgi:hypothetical protein
MTEHTAYKAGKYIDLVGHQPLYDLELKSYEMMSSSC